MSNKIKLLAVLMIVSCALCLISNTYSRYVADTTGNVELSFTKWQILVNEADITNNSSSEIAVTPTILDNPNIAANKIAPSSKGYFDIDIDSSNVELSYDYTITLNVENENIPDLMITKYSILDSNYKDGDEIQVNNIEGNTISSTLNYDKTKENFKFEPFTIRIYFEWFEGQDEKMDDSKDTEVGINAEANKLKINANIKFQQKL